MRIHPFVYGILVLTVFFGIILGFQAAGVWSVSGKTTSSGDQVQPSATDVETIKGWMTLEQVTATYDVPLDELLGQFGLPADTPATTAIKDLESETFDLTILKAWLEERMSPVETSLSVEPTAMPAQATLEEPVEVAVTPTEEHTPIERKVSGNTTFQNILDWGVTQETIEEIIGAPLPEPATLVKDYALEQGLEFGTIKTLLQAEVDAINP